MLTQTFNQIFDRNLQRLAQQMNAYTDEDALWAVAPGITNSAGNLCLHILGNLNTYIGATLGHTDYVRNRTAEFATAHIPRSILLAELTRTRSILNATFELLTDEQLNETYPEETLGFPMTIHFFLVHLSGHLMYHLGQIDYHRRLLTQEGAVSYED